LNESLNEGFADGTSDKASDGLTEGFADNTNEGLYDGLVVGTSVGIGVGLPVGDMVKSEETSCIFASEADNTHAPISSCILLIISTCPSSDSSHFWNAVENFDKS